MSEPQQKVMKIIDEITGLMECRVCGWQHRAHIMPGIVGRRKIDPSSWECPKGCTLKDWRKKVSQGVEVEKRIKTILRLHTEIAGHMWKSPKKAIRIGQLLTEQKESLKHGEFTPWLKANVPFTKRTAQGYMRLYQDATGPIAGESKR